MEIRYQIVRMLSDGRFHSGEALAAAFGVSRAAIWKQIGHIREQLGLDLFAVRGRGYRLAQPLELLEKELIFSSIPKESRRLLSKLEIHHRITSTNSYLMELGAKGVDSGCVSLAEQQHAGRGRRGRQWISPYGSNIYLSILWRYALAPADLTGLSLAVGIGVMRSLEALGVRGVGLKWPNDLLCGDRKLAGLLLEVTGEQTGPSCVVLGLGFNTLLTETQGADIDQPWTDLAHVPGGRDIPRNELVAVLLGNLLEVMAGFEREGLAPFKAEWQRHDLYHGKAVVLQMGTRRIEGIHSGIDSSGALLLEENGEVKVYHGGEVSLRPL